MNIKPLLIYNPSAGKGNAGKILPKVEALLHNYGFEYDLMLTTGPGDALRWSQEAAEKGCELVVIGGGDGTVNEVVNGLMLANLNGKPRPAIGVLPVGRGNDFAFGMNIPQDISLACENLAKGKRSKIDVGRVTGGDYPQGRYFGNGVGLGFDTVVGFEAAKIKWLHGGASYLVAVLRTIFSYAHAPVYEVVLDHETIRQPFLMVSIMNGKRMGGSFHMAPKGDPGDGTFDLCMAGEVKQIRILPVAVTFMKGTQEKDPAVRMVRSRTIRIRAIQGTIPAHADGETICTNGDFLSIELLPAALDIVSVITRS